MTSTPTVLSRSQCRPQTVARVTGASLAQNPQRTGGHGGLKCAFISFSSSSPLTPGCRRTASPSLADAPSVVHYLRLPSLHINTLPPSPSPSHSPSRGSSNPHHSLTCKSRLQFLSQPPSSPYHLFTLFCCSTIASFHRNASPQTPARLQEFQTKPKSRRLGS